MRAIKNFFHNINDILLAVIIVAIASGIIYWRMQIILDYPKELAEDQAQQTYEQQDQAEEEAAAEAADSEEDKAKDKSKDKDKKDNTSEDKTSKDSE